MRPTTKRRVIILATTAVLGSLALGGAYEVRQYQIKAKALASRRQFEDALAASTQLNELAPTDLDGQILTLLLMSPQYLNLPAKDILARADKNAAAHPKDPRFVMLQGFAFRCTGDKEK